MQQLEIRIADFDDPHTRDLLALHLAGMRASSPPDSVYALDLSGLKKPEITTWAAWRGDRLAGVGALRMLSADAAEIKSMRTHPDFLKQGVGKAILTHIVETAKQRGVKRLSLETGSGPAFDAAVLLYRNFGFQFGEPFGDYVPTGFSQFLHLEIA